MKKINELFEKIEKKDGTATPFGEKVLKILAIGLVVVVLLLVLIIASSIGMFNWLELEVRTLTGLDGFLTKGITFILLALFFGTPLSGFAWSLLPVPQKNKKRKRLIFLLVLAVLCFVSYFASKNVYFNVENGQPLKYFSVGVNGEYNFSNSDGYDPITGDKLQQVDRATIIQYLNGEAPSKNTNLVEPGKNNLIGLEKDARFYPVEFENNTNRNFYLCISFNSSTSNGIIIQRIASGQRLKLSLMEGNHFFGYIDNNGASYGGRTQPFFLKRFTLLQESLNPFDVFIGEQLYHLEKTFSLNVLVSSGQKVTLREDSTLHSKELNRAQETWWMFLIGIPLLFVILYFNDRLTRKAGLR